MAADLERAVSGATGFVVPGPGPPGGGALAGKSKLTAVAVAVLGGFGVLLALSAAGSPVAPGAVHASAAVALTLALAAGARTVASAWRGPVLVQFPREGAIECDPAESAEVRAGAQLRGTLGGAGHVHPGRLALPALAWTAAATIAGFALRETPLALSWPASVLVLALAAATALPAVPFWYRESRGGVVLLYPRAAFEGLVRRSRRRDGGSASSAQNGWGTSPIATETGAKAADVHAAGYADNRP